MKFKVLLLSLLGFIVPQQSLYADLNAYQLSWGLSSVTIDGVIFDTLKLDMELGPRYVQAAGELVSAPQSLSHVQIPVTGSCVFTFNNGVNCTLFAGLKLIDLNISSSGSGTYTVKTNTGSEVGTGMAWIVTIF